MAANSNATVFLILIPLFVTVALYLLWYARRRGRMLAAFAEDHGVRILPDRANELQATLNGRFALRDRGMARSFDQVTSPIDAGGIWLFRAVELLDLNPHAGAESTHYARICALFDADPAHSAFFLLSPFGSISTRLPESPALDPRLAGRVRQAADQARHTLSVTLAGGKGLIYFEPLVTGGENRTDLEALHDIASTLRAMLSGEITGRSAGLPEDPGSAEMATG